jgi:hypothetical protein
MPLFKDIPVELRDVSIIQRWLSADGNYFDQIPSELATDELRRIAIKDKPEQIIYMCPKDTACFDGLMTMSLRSSPGLITSIDLSLVSPAVLANHITERVIAKRCYPGGKNALEYFFDKKEWGCDVERVQYVNDMVIFNHLTLGFFNINDITDETIIKSWLMGNTSYYFFSKIDESGRGNVYMKMAREEHWPSCIEKPLSLNAAVWRVMRLDESGSGEWQLIRAYIKNHPVADVCRYMTKTKGRVDMLYEIFSAEEILPYIEGNSMAKSQVLKNDMGL